MPRKDAGQAPTAQAQQDLTADGIANFELPKSLVTRIAKSAIPENAKLQKETVLALIKGSTVFINYLAATAHDIALSKQHKSISASDVLKALELIEFGDMVGMLQGELQIYKENQKGKKNGTSVGPVAISTSVSTSSKAKGKAKAAAPATESISAHLAQDSEPELIGDEDEEMGEASEPAEDEPEEDVDEEEGDEEEVVDRMAVEEEEVRQDNLSIEKRERQEMRDKQELAGEHHQ